MKLGRFQVALLVAALFGAMFLYWHLFPSLEPIDSADGVYANSCCGSFSLQHGVLRVRDLEVPYTVEHNKNGQYVLPERFLGVFGGTRVDAMDRTPLMLDLDRSGTTQTIRLFGDDGRDYEFAKQSAA